MEHRLIARRQAEDKMLTTDELETVLDEVWSVLQKHDLSWTQAGLVWDALGELIFNEGGSLDRKNAISRIVLYVEEKYRGEIEGGSTNRLV
jgi:hypothetical protein